MSDGYEVTLAECPPGLFLFGADCLGFKSEYAYEAQGRFWPEAYVVASGEAFWGGVNTQEARAKLLVRPIDVTAYAFCEKPDEDDEE